MLYDFEGEFGKLTGKPVFHLFNYTDPDSDSEVDKDWEEGVKQKACLLISMIYERALAAGNDKTVAKTNIFILLESFGVHVGEDIRFDNPAGAGELKLPKTADTYRLVGALHAKLHEAEDTKRYDLSHVNEKILGTQYDLVAAPNCRLDKLGETVELPLGIYLFHVGNKNRDIGAGDGLKGHATTVQVLRQIKGGLPAGVDIETYYKNYNESTSNFRGSALAKETIVGSIWKKK